MRTISLLVATLASAMALAAPVVTAAPAADASSVPKTVTYGFGPGCPALQHGSWVHPMVRPRQGHFSLSCEVGIHRIRWRTWHRRSAFGHGSFLLFTGTGYSNRPATIALSRTRLHKGRRYFSHLVIVWTARNSTHHKLVMNWRDNKPIHHWMWF